MLNTVTKYDGTTEPFSAEKLNRLATYAAMDESLMSDISLNTLTQLYDGVSTQDIIDSMIKYCVLKEDIRYSKAAARLEEMVILKNAERLGIDCEFSFYDTMYQLLELGIWDADSIPAYEPCLEFWLHELNMYRPEYWTVKQWSDKYGCKYKGKCVETVQIGAIGIGLAHFGVTDEAYRAAKAIVQGKLNLPTPALNGGRNGDFDSVSCSVITGGDTTESIGVAEHVAYRMTAKKAGIGIELDTRSKGAPVKGGRVEHLGKHPLYKCIDSAVKAMTQVTRGGSATVTFKCIDPEITQLLQWKTQKVDIETRIDKLDYSFAYTNAFMEALIKREDWNLYDLHLAPQAHEALYKDMNLAEWKEVTKDLPVAGTINALDLGKLFRTSRGDTGRIYAFNLSRANTHTPFKDPIRLSNLCVAPETMILTKQGYQEIATLKDQILDIWNGEEWSEVEVVKTGENQELIKVTTSLGNVLECTEYHKFYTDEGVEVRAGDLEVGQQLLDFKLPKISGNNSESSALLDGIFTATGSTIKGKDYVYLKGSNIDYRTLLLNKPEMVNEAYFGEVTRNQINKDSALLDLDIASKCSWLSGFLSAAGRLDTRPQTPVFVAQATDLGVVKKVQLLLQTLGIKSKVGYDSTINTLTRMVELADGTIAPESTTETYKLTISQSDYGKLLNLGVKVRNYYIKVGNMPEVDMSLYITEVERTGRISDTYCFTEAKRGMGMFNGILTGQCQEIMLPTKPYEDMLDLYAGDVNGDSKGEVAFCSLAAINYGKALLSEIPELTDIALRIVDSMIERAPGMTEPMKRQMLKRRSVGIGITGLANYLYANGLDYDGSPESFEAVNTLAEAHMFHLYKNSIKMLEETGLDPVDVTDWLPIDTRVNAMKYTTKMPWESIRGLPRQHSVLVAHMPTESSAVNIKGGL